MLDGAVHAAERRWFPTCYQIKQGRAWAHDPATLACAQMAQRSRPHTTIAPRGTVTEASSKDNPASIAARTGLQPKLLTS